MFLILNRSSVGLSESVQQEHDDIALHDRFQTIWKQCVIHAAYLCPRQFAYLYFISAAAAASLMNTVILSSVISAGNHALFAGTRVLYGLAQVSQAPSLFARTTREGVPLPAMLLTSSVSALCFGSSYVGNGQLWAWLQNLVGVSNQVRVVSRFSLLPWPGRRPGATRSSVCNGLMCMRVPLLLYNPVPCRVACNSRSRGCRLGSRRGAFAPRGRSKAGRSRR